MKSKISLIVVLLLTSLITIAPLAGEGTKMALANNSTNPAECADCAACETKMTTIRSLYWSPGPPPEGNWCEGQKAAVQYCYSNCIPCQVCITWKSDYDSLCGGGDSSVDCGLTLDGSYSNSCDCNPGDPLCTSPVLIDVAGNGFRLTNVALGVNFDLRATGTPIKTAWTEPDSDDAWLVLDRNGNGMVDNGSELFGNFSSQPETAQKNGFLALAEFDKAEQGGNGDGLIDNRDVIFKDLRLWLDKNHNGVSESVELIMLAAGAVQTLSLDYKESRRMDPFANVFRYRAKVNGERYAYDVFLTTEH